MKTLIIIFVSILSFSPCFSQDSSLHKLYLITCDPGDELYSSFGHSAIRWNDKSQNIDAVFNYGTFDFRTPGFYIKFIKGQLPYQLSVSSYGDFLQEYYYEKRGVIEQELLLSEKDKMALIDFLRVNALPENSKYKYDFFFDNCSTRIRDAVEKTSSSPVIYSVNERSITFRDYLHRYLISKPWTQFGIDLIIGSPADREANTNDQMFLPDRLMTALSSAKANGMNILGRPYEVLLFSEEKNNRLKGPFFTPSVFFIFLTISFFILYKINPRLFKVLKKIVYFITFLSSLLICFLWFGTDHLATKYNYNIFWMSPLFLLLILNYKRGMVAKIILGSILCASLSYLGVLPQSMPFITFFCFLSFLMFTEILENFKTETIS